MTLEEKVNILMCLCYDNLEEKVVTKLIDYLTYDLCSIIKKYKSTYDSDNPYNSTMIIEDKHICGTERFKLDECNEFCIHFYTDISKDMTTTLYINEDNEYYDELLHLYNYIINESKR